MGRGQTQALAGGIYADLLTPRKPGTTDADAAALLDYLDRTIGAGVNGIVLFGATGEFIHFDPLERARVATLAVRRSRVPVLVNVSHSTMVGTIALAESALNIGAAGVLLMPPYFYPYSEEDIYAFYQQTCAILGGQIAIYLYNLPASANLLSCPLIERLLSLPGVAGVEDSSNDPQLFGKLQELRTRIDFRLMAGHDRLYANARKSRADGAISGIAAALPEILVALDRAIVEGNATRVSLLESRLLEFLPWMEALPPVLANRETASFRGWIKNEPVLPLSPETQGKVSELRSWLSSWLPIMLSECSAVSMSDSKSRR